MNKRIKELAEQAKQYAREQMAHPMDSELFSASVFQEKFAELLIDETVNVVCNVRVSAIADFEINDRKELNKFLVSTSSVAMIDAVDKHFGVEK